MDASHDKTDKNDEGEAPTAARLDIEVETEPSARIPSDTEVEVEVEVVTDTEVDGPVVVESVDSDESSNLPIPSPADSTSG